MSGRPCAKAGSTITHASHSPSQLLHRLTIVRPTPNSAVSPFMPNRPRIVATSLLYFAA
jgi:hypothetical protein